MKNSIKKFAFIFALFHFLGLASCGSNCYKDSPSHYKITDFNWETLRTVDTTDVEGFLFSPIEGNSVVFHSYSIKLGSSGHKYYSFLKELNSFSLIGNSYACSPILPSTNDKIERIEIYCNQDFDSINLNSTNMVDLFDVITYKEQSYQLERINIQAFLINKPIIPEELILVLNQSPEETGIYSFTVKMYLDGIDLDYFEFTTNPIEIRTN
jgi:hypothetical protein